MEDDGLQGDLQMVDVAAVDHGLQGEVIDLPIMVCVGFSLRFKHSFGFIYQFWICFIFFCFHCRMRYRLHQTPYVLLRSQTQMIPS